MASNEIEVLDPAATVEKIKQLASGRALNRRHFMAALGMTTAAAGAGLITGCSSSTTTPVTSSSASIGQPDVLNFALNLEYLEATFYSYIVKGTDLSSSLTVGSGAITGAPSGPLTFTGPNASQIADMLAEIYYDEISHVADLRSILGSYLVPRPAINLAALGAITANNALSLARTFEDVGVTAYAGAAAALTDSSLSYAAQILAVESFHSGALRLVSIQNPTIAAYVAADTLDVPPVDPGTPALAAAGPTAKGGFFATAGAATATTTTPAGFAYTRTTSQVLSIVYAAGGVAGTKQGGFFPNGVNGLINTV
jgi:hypothetical protein